MKLNVILAASVAFAGLGVATPAHAALTLVGDFKGNECGGPGGFPNCYAYQNGTTSQGQTGGGSPAIFKLNSNGTTDTGSFPSISGTEFAITYASGTNTLSFNYTPGANDPVIHYVAINQANYTYLFYDAGPVTSGTFSLDSYFKKNPGYSHITFFDTGSTPPPPPAVPEPATWAMMIGGFGMVGGSMRYRRRTNATPANA